MSAEVIPFPSPIPFDFQQRTYDGALSVLRRRFPFATEEERRRAAGDIALVTALTASAALPPFPEGSMR